MLFSTADGEERLDYTWGQEALRQAHAELEQRVQDRTTELTRVNEILQQQAEEMAAQAEELEAQTDELQAQADALRESEERFHSLYTSMAEGLALHELSYDEYGRAIDYILLDINPTYEAITNLSREQVVGRKASDVYGVWPAPYLDVYAPVALSGKPTSFETYFAPMGKHFSISAFSPRYGQFATVFSDITVRKQAEQEREQLLTQVEQERWRAETLAESLQKERDVLQAIMENTQAQLAYLDPQFNFIRVNLAYAQGCGHSVEELIGANHFTLFPSAENQAIFEQVRDTGEPTRFQAKSFDFPGQPERGTTYWDWTLMPVHGARGQVQGLVLSLLDVTTAVRARQRIEELASKAEQQANELDAVFRAMTEGVIVFDAQGRVVRTNPAELHLLGSPFPVDRQEEIKRFSYRLGKDGPTISLEELPSSRALAGETVVGERVVLTTPAGRDLTILSSAAPLVQGGRVVGAVAIHTDVTEIEEARVLSEALNRINARVSSSPNVDIAMQQVVDEAARALGADVGGFARHEGTRWVLQYQHGPSSSLSECRFANLEPAIAPWIVARRDVLVIDDLVTVPQFRRLAAQPSGLRSILVIPLLLKEQAMGVLMLGRRSPHAPFSPHQVDFARKLGGLLSLALENARLYEQTRQEAETRAVLLREVNHRVKNNLAAIIGLLYAQQNRPEVKGQLAYQNIIKELVHWTTGLSIAHQMLSNSDWAPVRLDDLTGQIAQSSFQTLPRGQVMVQIQPCRVRVSPDQAHTLALVLNELALNVVKHTLSRRESCSVQVHIGEDGNEAVLIWRDDGPGYPDPVLQRTKSSVGMEIVRNLVARNLRGQLTLCNDGGAVAEVRFPTKDGGGGNL